MPVGLAPGSAATRTAREAGRARLAMAMQELAAGALARQVIARRAPRRVRTQDTHGAPQDARVHRDHVVRQVPLRDVGAGRASRRPAGQARPSPARRRFLARLPADHLEPPPGLAKGPLQQVRVADAAPLLGRGAQVRGGARQVLQETSHCGQIEALPALVERVGRSRAATLAASRGRLSAPSAIFQESHVTSSQ